MLRVQETLDHHPEQDFRLDAEARCEAHVRLGDLLVEHGDIDETELQAALVEQQRTRLPLGELLLGRGAVSQGQLDRAVGMQRRMLGAVFTVGIAIAGMGDVQAASDTGAMSVASLYSATSISAPALDADLDVEPTLSDLLPKPDIKALQARTGEALDTANVTLKGFVQNVSGMFDKVNFEGMESHFGAMDANTARDRDAYSVTNESYVGVTFKVNFSSGAGKKGKKDLNLNFLPDDY